MGSTDHPVTTAVRALKAAGIPFVPHLYKYEEHGGTAHAARSLGVDEHAVVKTLVMEADAKKPLLVLMHGDREVSTRQLARTLGLKRVVPCDPQTAHRHTGYMVGGISPFGTRVLLPIAVEVSILSLDRIYINGGKRGFLVEIDPSCLTQAFPGLFRVSVGLAAGTLE
jgi:Cys-tRNA(Pro) deacylase